MEYAVGELSAMLLGSSTKTVLQALGYIVDNLDSAPQVLDELSELVGREEPASLGLTVGDVATIILAASGLITYEGGNPIIESYIESVA